MKMTTVHAERISQTAEITLNRGPEEVFPLFGAIEEKKWADGWEPDIIYTKSGEIEENMVFKTKPHAHHEPDYLWVVSKYDPDKMLVVYTVSTDERVWSIAIGCSDNGDGTTRATITYTFTGLSKKGSKLNRQALENMSKENLKDWERAINHYLETGTRLKH